MAYRKNINKIFLLGLLLCPILFLAQETSANQMLQFLKGDGSVENAFMDGIRTMNSVATASATKYLSLGKSIALLGVMIQFAWIGWGMFSGSREWDIMPMIKPTILALLLVNWTYFYNGIKAPFEVLAQPSVSMFNEIENKVNKERVKRFEKQMQIVDEAIKLQAKTQKAAREEENKRPSLGKLDDAINEVVDAITPDFGSAWDNLMLDIQEMYLKTNMSAQRIVGEFIEAIGLTFLRVATYFIFFIQKVWSGILIIFGPIAFGMALIPGFENSLYSWISKFINVNLYTTIAYQIISLGHGVILASYKMENQRYSLIVDDAGVVKNEGLLLAFVSNTGFIHIILFSVVAYFVTGVAVLMTPTIADSIVSAGGGMVATKMKGASATIIGGAKSVGSGAKTTLIGNRPDGKVGGLARGGMIAGSAIKSGIQSIGNKLK